MNRKFFAIIMSLLLSCVLVSAQESAKSSLQQRAEEEASSGKVANARSLYIRAFEDYASKGQMRQSVECGAKATALYYRLRVPAPCGTGYQQLTSVGL